MRFKLLAIIAMFAPFAFGQSGATGHAFYIKLRLASPVKLSALKTGEVLQGNLVQDVYSGERDLFPAGSQVRLTVDHLERRRRARNDHWPWVIRFFSPRHQNFPAFQTASISSVEEQASPPAPAIHVSITQIISITQKDDIWAKSRKSRDLSALQSSSAPKTSNSSLIQGTSNRKAGQIVTLLAVLPNSTPADTAALAPAIGIPTGTQGQVILLDAVSASRSRPGDRVAARLIEPVRVGSTIVLPEGTLFQGKVLKSKRPRWLSRPGSILFSFFSLQLPGGQTVPIAASIAGAEFDRGSHTRIDPEGRLRGGPPGKAWLLIDAGVTAGIAKETDDGLQLVIEAIVSTATDASTAGVGRIAAAGTSAVFMITRHGRDVILPKFTELNVVFDRPLSFAP
jgi:hypothetical protein